MNIKQGRAAVRDELLNAADAGAELQQFQNDGSSYGGTLLPAAVS